MQEQIILHTDTHASNLGGKANQLLQLCKADMPVPKFIVIPHALLLQLIGDASSTWEQQKLSIENATIPENLIENITNHLGEAWYAVRSSGGDEDGQKHSFAGQYETKLFINKINLSHAIKAVWLSAYSQRVLDYRQANNLPLSNNINIIVQAMVHATCSGVAFGVNPITGNAAEAVINNVYGVGEGLVNGEINADQYIVNANNEIIETISNKDIQYTIAVNGGIKKIAVPLHLQNVSSLQNAQVLIIKKYLDALCQMQKHPQDIEYAFDAENNFYLLQARPITTAFGKTKTVYDNSNIIESYPGLTSPLTYSFISKMYESVYEQLSHILGVRAQKISENSSVYANMLALIKGRVFYNLNNWYLSLALLPGYNLNAGFMEKMMGVKEKMDVMLPKAGNKWQQWSDVLYAIKKIFSVHQNIKKERAYFTSHFNGIMQTYDAIDFEAKTLEELVILYKTFEHTLVTKWNAPLINDFFAMVYFGLLQKQIKKYNLDKGETLHNELLAGNGDIISTEPANLCIHIAAAIKENKQASALFASQTDEAIWQKLNEGTMPEIKKLFEYYLQKWGARCVGELKLETITYNQQPWILVRIIKSYLQQGTNASSINASHALQVRHAAEKQVAENLHGIKKKIFNYILKQARDLVSNRENLRYERTKGFAMVRNMFLAIDKKMLQQNYLENPRDIFWLTQEEVFSIIANKNGTAFWEIIATRKTQYTIWQNEIMPERLQTYSNVQQHYFTTPNKNFVEGELRGLPCCAGIVEARVCILENPLGISDLQGDILVTSSTDPGWVTLFPTASAILVERGSLLSHSAIVSREMGIPCIVGITGLLQQLKTGDVVRMNGSTGEIKIIKNA